MKLESLQEAINKIRFILEIGGKLPDERLPYLRILENSLEAMDGTHRARVKLDGVTIEDLDSVVIAPNKLVSLLSSLSGDEIIFSTQDEKLVLKNKTGSRQTVYKLNVRLLGQDQRDLQFDSVDLSSLPEGLIEGIKLCLPCICGEITRGPLCGLFLGDGLVLSSDGFSIAQYTYGKKKNEDTSDVASSGFVLDSQLAQQIIKYEEKNLVYSIKNNEITFRLLIDNQTNLDLGAVELGAKGQYPIEHTLSLLKRIDSLNYQQELPNELIAILESHISQLGDVISIDREVKVSLQDNKLVLTSTDNRFYEMSDTLELVGKIQHPIQFMIQPITLLRILQQSRKMLYGDEDNLVAFQNGSFSYLASIDQIVEGQSIGN